MLKENKKLDIDYILKDLDKYKPKEEVGFGESIWKILKWDLLNIETVQNL